MNTETSAPEFVFDHDSFMQEHARDGVTRLADAYGIVSSSATRLERTYHWIEGDNLHAADASQYLITQPGTLGEDGSITWGSASIRMSGRDAPIVFDETDHEDGVFYNRLSNEVEYQLARQKSHTFNKLLRQLNEVEGTVVSPEQAALAGQTSFTLNERLLAYTESSHVPLAAKLRIATDMLEAHLPKPGMRRAAFDVPTFANSSLVSLTSSPTNIHVALHFPGMKPSDLAYHVSFAKQTGEATESFTGKQVPISMLARIERGIAPAARALLGRSAPKTTAEEETLANGAEALQYLSRDLLSNTEPVRIRTSSPDINASRTILLADPGLRGEASPLHDVTFRLQEFGRLNGYGIFQSATLRITVEGDVTRPITLDLDRDHYFTDPANAAWLQENNIDALTLFDAVSRAVLRGEPVPPHKPRLFASLLRKLSASSLAQFDNHTDY